MTEGKEDNRARSPKPDNDDDEQVVVEESRGASVFWTSVKLLAAVSLCWSAFSGHAEQQLQKAAPQQIDTATAHRRLTEETTVAPAYMDHLFKDLGAREKLFADTPPEEVKYWFEYTGPLQVSLVPV